MQILRAILENQAVCLPSRPVRRFYECKTPLRDVLWDSVEGVFIEQLQLKACRVLQVLLFPLHLDDLLRELGRW